MNSVRSANASRACSRDLLKKKLAHVDQRDADQRNDPVLMKKATSQKKSCNFQLTITLNTQCMVSHFHWLINGLTTKKSLGTVEAISSPYNLVVIIIEFFKRLCEFYTSFRGGSIRQPRRSLPVKGGHVNTLLRQCSAPWHCPNPSLPRSFGGRAMMGRSRK